MIKFKNNAYINSVKTHSDSITDTTINYKNYITFIKIIILKYIKIIFN